MNWILIVDIVQFKHFKLIEIKAYHSYIKKTWKHAEIRYYVFRNFTPKIPVSTAEILREDKGAV